MKQLTCEMCGSTDLTKQDGVFVCQTCGTKYSVEEAKKMMVEGTVDVSGSTVKVDDTSKLDNYLEIAKGAIKSNNYREAEQYCNKALEIDSQNVDAWYLKGASILNQSTVGVSRISEAISFFNKALNLAENDIQRKTLSCLAARDLINITAGLFKGRGEFHDKTASCKSAELIKAVLVECENYTIPFLRNNIEHDLAQAKEANLRANNYVVHFLASTNSALFTLSIESLDWCKRRRVAYLDPKKNEEVTSRLMASMTARDCVCEFIIKTDQKQAAAGMDKDTYDTYKKTITRFMGDPVKVKDLALARLLYLSPDEESKLEELYLKWERYAKRIDPSYEPKKPEPVDTKPNTTTNTASTTNSGCYVATAVYGSYDCPQVWTLRRYRDYTLAETWRGRAFIRTYYAISPTLVKWFGHTEWFKRMWRGKLDHMVANLNAEGIANTPYEDRIW